MKTNEGPSAPKPPTVIKAKSKVGKAVKAATSSAMSPESLSSGSRTPSLGRTQRTAQKAKPAAETSVQAKARLKAFTVSANKSAFQAVLSKFGIKPKKESAAGGYNGRG